jgi:hypothetical protein
LTGDIFGGTDATACFGRAPKVNLSDTTCRNAKAKAKSYKLADGEGLYLEVMPNGGRYWRLKYRFGGKEKPLSFGVYPQTTLLETRNKRAVARKILASGCLLFVAGPNSSRQ